MRQAPRSFREPGFRPGRRPESRSRRAAVATVSVTESFVTLKKELIHLRLWPTWSKLLTAALCLHRDLLQRQCRHSTSLPALPTYYDNTIRTEAPFRPLLVAHPPRTSSYGTNCHHSVNPGVRGGVQYANGERGRHDGRVGPSFSGLAQLTPGSRAWAQCFLCALCLAQPATWRCWLSCNTLPLCAM